MVKADGRHTALNLRNFEAIDKRIFPSWEMGYKDVSGSLNIQSNTQADVKEFEGLLNAELDFTNDGVKLLQLFYQQSS